MTIGICGFATPLLAATLVLTASSLWGQTVPSGAANGCAQLVDENGRRLGDNSVVTWRLRAEAGQRRRLDRQCRTLGPIVLRTGPAHRTAAPTGRSLMVIGWNVHVGGGDVEQLIDRLIGSEPDRASAPDYVLLLEEAYRAGGQIPISLEPGVRVPRRIAPRAKEHTRQDIVSLARRRGLALYYVPSMRNGQGPPYEDRGNAILSTLPLSDLTAIELPIDRQRRVAIGATVQGMDAQSRPWRLRLVTAHFDALVGARRLWMFAVGWRGQQARTIVEALDRDAPTVVGADLNTWLAGRRESAYRRLAGTAPVTSRAFNRHGRCT